VAELWSLNRSQALLDALWYGGIFRDALASPSCPVEVPVRLTTL
jgi:hypothetical protein